MLRMEEATKLLDFNQKLDIGLLENIVGCLYASHGKIRFYRFLNTSNIFD